MLSPNNWGVVGRCPQWRGGLQLALGWAQCISQGDDHGGESVLQPPSPAELPKLLHGDLPYKAPSRYLLLSQAPDSKCNQAGRRAGVQGITEVPFLYSFPVPGLV